MPRPHLPLLFKWAGKGILILFSLMGLFIYAGRLPDRYTCFPIYTQSFDIGLADLDSGSVIEFHPHQESIYPALSSSPDGKARVIALPDSDNNTADLYLRTQS